MIQEIINAEINALRKQTPKVISEPKCHAGTKVYALLSNLNGETSVGKVKALATLSEEDKKRRRKLEADLDNDPHIIAGRLERTVHQLSEANQKLETLQYAVSYAKIAKLSELQSSHTTARATAQTAATKLFKDHPLPHVGSDVWRKLWDVAREYSEQQAYPNLPFPVIATDKYCVLCQQVLGDEAITRLQSFENFVKDKAKSEEDRARKAHQEALDEIEKSNVLIKDISDIADLLRDEDQELADLARTSAIKNKWRLRSILHNHRQESKAKLIASAGSYPSEAISQHVKTLRERIKGLKAEKNSEKRKRMRSQLEELKACEWLATIQKDVIAEIERLKKRKTLENAAKGTTTNKITAKSSELAERLVTDALCKRFRSEVDKFNVTGLEVELRKEKSSQGVPLFRIFLTRNQRKKVTTQEVLSEGEHRCVAIATFLAELATSESNSAIVFDDPVSSLDHAYKDKVAERLAEEGKHRQIIVFTHDIVFLSFLNDSCKRNKSNFDNHAVVRTSSNTGIVQHETPLRAQKVKKVIDRIQNQLDGEKFSHKQGNRDKWESATNSLIDLLRSTWERAVEEVVEPVLKRMSNKVKTAGLVELTVLNEEDCQTMRDAFQRLSELLHSSADAVNKPTPTPENIQREIDTLRDWFKNIKDRQQKIKGKIGHASQA